MGTPPAAIAPPPSAHDAPPDWGAVADAVACPLCGYELRGLTEPRCPECGYAFAWHEILDPNRRLHPYLFEHHPERPVSSFAQTVYGGLNPRAFWELLRPNQPSSVRRLVGYIV